MPINTHPADAPGPPAAGPLKRLALRLRVVAVASVITAAGLALAASSPYYVGVSQTFGHESNLLRLNEAAAGPDGYSRSDTVASTALLAGIDQPFGRQRLRGDVALRANRYIDNDVFNNQSYTASVALDWATVNRLSGTLAGSANRALSSFNRQEVGLLRDKNFEDTKTLDANVRLGVVTQYSLLASAGHRRVDNSLQLDRVQSRNFQQDTGSLGVRWQPSSLLSLGLGVRTTQGRYPQFQRLANGSFQADRFKRNDVDLTADYQASGASTVSARLSSGQTEYDLASQRNFSGVTGSLNWGWQASGKLRINTSLSRDTGQDSYAVSVFNTPATADYSRVNTTLRVGADWAATSKIAITTSVVSSQRELVRSLPAQAGQTINDTGRERSTAFAVGARWAPTRSSLVGCNASTDRITGSGVLATTNVKGTGINCYGQLTLQ